MFDCVLVEKFGNQNSGRNSPLAFGSECPIHKSSRSFSVNRFLQQDHRIGTLEHLSRELVRLCNRRQLPIEPLLLRVRNRRIDEQRQSNHKRFHSDLRVSLWAVVKSFIMFSSRGRKSSRLTLLKGPAGNLYFICNIAVSC